MSLLIFILLCLSITNIIVREYIFKEFRLFIEKRSKFLGKMVNCETCFGFWIGLILLLIFPNLIIFYNKFLINCIFGGLISSISNKIINIILYKI